MYIYIFMMYLKNSSCCETLHYLTWIMLINFETYRERHVPKVQWIIQFPDVVPPCISRFLMSCCQTVEGCVRIKHSNTGFNTRWKAYLTWQYSRNNRSDLSKMVHARILTLFRNVGCLRKKKRKGKKEKKRNLYKALWSDLNCAKRERHKTKKQKNAQNLIIYIIYYSLSSFNP